MLLSLVVLQSCVRGSDDRPVDDSGPPIVDSHSGDSDSGDSDSGDSDSTDTTDTTDTAATAGIVLQNLDVTTFSSVGYAVAEYRVTAAAPDAYTSPFPDAEPVFYVLMPADARPDEELPMVLFHHGGAIGDDRTAMPRQCQEVHLDNWLTTQTDGSRSLAWMAAERRWAMVLPRNDWCDGWQGLGPDDPVDPVHHFGGYHESRVLDFMRAGGAGFGVDRAKQYLWGTSAGGGTAVSSAYRDGGFAAVIMDSGFSSFFSYYELPGSDGLPETGDLEDVLGGPPYDVDGNPNGVIYDRYQSGSPDWEITDGGFTPRLFVAWNQQDLNMQPRYGQEMEVAVAAGLPARGAGTHDFNRPFPTTDHHVQTVYLALPNGYYTWALYEFLEGADMQVEEAESGCAAAACVGVVHTAAEDQDYSRYSGGAERESALGEVGVLYRADVPDTVIAGVPTRVAVVLELETAGLPSTEYIGRIVVAESGVDVGTLSLTAGDLAPPGSTAAGLLVRQFESTFLSYTPSAAADAEVRFETSGAAVLRIDSAIWLMGG
jgi:hypothetical protein